MNKSLITVLALSVGVSAAAQNLNPEVIVTNEYETKMPAVSKTDLAMASPDSLKEFKFSFDYSVFEHPYKGAYEFSPYVVELVPDKSELQASRFFLRAGAGYSLHPQFDFAWVPLRKKGADITLFQNFGGYFGKYRTVGADLHTTAAREDGYDLSEVFGARARFKLFKTAECEALVRYEGLFSSLSSESSSWNNVSAAAGVRSSAGSQFQYDLGLTFNAGVDRTVPGSVSAQSFTIGGRIEPVFENLGFRILADLNVEYNAVSNALSTGSAVFSVAPKAAFRIGVLDLLAGINLAIPGSPASNGGMYAGTGQIVYPDVQANVGFLEGAINLYAAVTGGVKPVSYRSLKLDNHRLDLSWARGGALLQNEIERMNATIGLRGVITDWFQYDASAGYGFYADSPFFSVCNLLPAGQLAPVLGYADQGLFHADISANLHRKAIDFDAALAFRSSNVASGTAPVVLPALFEGEGVFSYTFAGRVKALVSAHASTARKALVPDFDGSAYSDVKTMTLPGYVDLGIGAEYILNRNWNFWGRVGNLLNSDVQIMPLYVEDGINFTLGVCLKL